jgi:peptidoglycan/LPS O-acetylase OafA/YrhL
LLLIRGPGIAALDGIRGTAAVMVFLSHALFAFAPWLMRVHYPTAQKAFPDPGPIAAVAAWAPSHLYIAVAIFFVLSGIVLASGSSSTEGRFLVLRRSVARYPRLMVPALVSTLLGCGLMMAGAMSAIPQASSLSGSAWLAQRYNFEPDLAAAAAQGAWYTFTISADSYNPPLWTLGRELVASWLLFAFLLVTKSPLIRLALLVPAVVAFSLLTDERLLLLGGCLLTGGVLAAFVMKERNIVGIIVLAAGLLLASYDFSDGMQWMRRLLNPVAVLVGFREEASELWLSLGALLIVFGAMMIGVVTKLLRLSVLQWLGKHTFAIYLLHFPILCSVGTWTYVSVQPQSALLAVVAAIFASAVTTGLLMLAFTPLIDKPAMTLGRSLGRILVPSRRRPQQAA